MRVAGFDPVFAIADEDLERSTDEKTSAVHFLRFALDAPRIAALREGAVLAEGIDHPRCEITVDPVPAPIRASLVGDLD
jgi:hypothetical protein